MTYRPGSPDAIENERLAHELDKLRPRQTGPALEAPESFLARASSMPADGMDAVRDALLVRLGAKRPAAAHPLVEAHNLTGHTLGELAALGVAIGTGRRELPAVRAALSSDALPELVESVASTVVSGIYAQGMGDMNWLAPAPLPNFKPSAYGTAGPADFALTREGEQIAASESEFTLSGEALQLRRYRARAIFSVEAWLSNSATALRTLLEVQAGAAVRLIRKLAFTALAANGDLQDGTAQFAAGRGNLLTGKALSAANLDLAEEALAELALASGEPLDVAGRYLIVAASKRATADALNMASGNKYTVVSSGHLSGASWWLLPAANVAPVFARAFLGETDPGVTVRQLPPDAKRDVMRFDFSIATAVAPVSPYAVQANV
jgi:hypothetical protein